ncbi:MAG: hypothetical protein PVH31_01655 [Ectothiorhodospiraceae bacterium]|jgi:hypothetical protein
MRKPTFAPAVAALILSGVSVCASAAITGAFGIELGSVFKPDSPREVRNGPNGQRSYVITNPPKPYSALDTYTVRVGRDGRVFEIVGSGTLKSADACKQEQAFIAETVVKKHGAAARMRTEDPLIDRTVLREGDRYVEIVCVGTGLDVRYRDPTVLSRSETPEPEKSGAKEPMISKPEDRDTSGL